MKLSARPRLGFVRLGFAMIHVSATDGEDPENPSKSREVIQQQLKWNPIRYNRLKKQNNVPIRKSPEVIHV